MNDSMSEMLLVGLSQSEWEFLMNYLSRIKDEDIEVLDMIIRKLTNQIY